MTFLVESLRAELSLLRIQLADSQALVARLTGSSEPQAPYSINGVLASAISNDKNDNIDLQRRIKALEQEKVERDNYINSLQSQVMQLSQVVQLPQQQSSSPAATSTVPRRSPPGNFSYPSNHALRTSDPLSPQAARYMYKEREETSDEMNALADKQLATNVLTQSQKSRDEARTLQLQIMQLKKREAEKESNGMGDIRGMTGDTVSMRMSKVAIPTSDGFI